MSAIGRSHAILSKFFITLPHIKLNMFENLSERLEKSFKILKGEGKITEVTEFEAGDLKFVIYPEESPEKLRAKSSDFDNDMSLVSMLYYRGHKLLFAADIEKERITEILDSSADLSCEWIKMPHHGRYNKKLKQLLDACSPAYAVITDSDEEVAATDTLVELQKRKVQTFSIRKGEVVTTVSDEGISVKYAE